MPETNEILYMNAIESTSTTHEFKCYICELKYQYNEFKYGKQEKDSYFDFVPDSFLLKNPFEKNPKRHILVGAKCYLCQNTVCASEECCKYYKNYYCSLCLKNKKSDIPNELLE
uniref:Cysteine-rich DPF motif domain-containing protein 1 n=1 Tax=Henneguya salminicola TaxID=69463 RepID=A0A6G3ML18_HENSL